MGPTTATGAQSGNQSRGLVMCRNVFAPLVAERARAEVVVVMVEWRV
jgi:hypothetical protein